MVAPFSNCDPVVRPRYTIVNAEANGFVRIPFAVPLIPRHCRGSLTHEHDFSVFVNDLSKNQFKQEHNK